MGIIYRRLYANGPRGLTRGIEAGEDVDEVVTMPVVASAAIHAA